MERKDMRGRYLKIGEDQMPDGRYRFRYCGTDGKRTAVYSWKLTASDRIPRGKRDSPSLREKEKAIWEELRDGIDRLAARSTTLDQMFEAYMTGKPGLKESTRSFYEDVYTSYIRPNLGKRSIDSIRYSDIRSFYIKMVTTGVPFRHRSTGATAPGKPFSPESVAVIQALLYPIFELAVRDGRIRSNPAGNALRDLKLSIPGRRKKRKALTEKQQERLVKFTAGSAKYREWSTLLTVFLGTGCRVGEIIGLRWEDCDLKNNLISINHTLIYRRIGNGRCCMHVNTPKTSSGVRTVPMLKEVREALLAEQKRELREGPCYDEVDGYSGFIFRNRRGHLHNPGNLNRQLERIRLQCNAEEEAAAAAEHREAVIVPHISAHSLRHTFCTRFCENETNLKMIQAIMGHADISTTMNIYAEATEEKKKLTMKRLEGKIKIS